MRDSLNTPDALDKDLPLQGRHAAPRPRARRRAARADRRRGLRADRGDSADGDRLSARGGRRSGPARARALAGLLNPLPIAQALEVVRAFSYFSHLANIAEDVHQNRRRRAHALAGSPPRRGRHRGSADAVSRRAVWIAPRLQHWLDDARISPVLTAHPTEVQRKSILDVEREIARLLTWRDRTTLTPDETEEFAFRPAHVGARAVADGDASLVAAAGERRDRQRPRVLPVHVSGRDPRLYRAFEIAGLRAEFGIEAARVPAFLRMGSWIGGDRDGNPYVDATTLSYAIRAQSGVALRALPRRSASPGRRVVAVDAARHADA